MSGEHTPEKTPFSKIGEHLPYLALAAGLLLTGFYLTNHLLSPAQYCRKIYFYLLPAHWPAWYAAILWLAALWIFGVFRFRFGGRVFLALLAAAAFFGSEHLRPVRQWIPRKAVALVIFIYEEIYLSFVYNPLIEYNLTGTFSWRLLTLPLLAAAIVAAAWAVQRHIKGKKQRQNHEKTDS
ncbi:MAG: hypothetical protein IKF77_05400 [Thermoguttaceae bacterium]|nr:hypothetical protein [Thermoguttaceae bacterium]